MVNGARRIGRRIATAMGLGAGTPGPVSWHRPARQGCAIGGGGDPVAVPCRLRCSTGGRQRRRERPGPAAEAVFIGTHRRVRPWPPRRPLVGLVLAETERAELAIRSASPGAEMEPGHQHPMTLAMLP